MEVSKETENKVVARIAGSLAVNAFFLFLARITFKLVMRTQQALVCAACDQHNVKL